MQRLETCASPVGKARDELTFPVLFGSPLLGDSRPSLLRIGRQFRQSGFDRLSSVGRPKDLLVKKLQAPTIENKHFHLGRAPAGELEVA
ncbi:hypothetical protein [Bradyrhizobium sp. STM 3843]|uniref:hypothetical protein n=1 Tax=Bradyrhizobium sp. STM 3843 TaxID=551947 RepID=UPI0011121522|nr:hypothetical protein [Bradyrhizobium sp. STM 3843]